MPARSYGDPEVDRVIDALPEDVRAIAHALRKLVRSAAPELSETVKWGNPFWTGRGNAVCLMLYPSHVHLGIFRGAELARRLPEIVGTGKSLRHVKVPDLASARRPVLQRILRAAVDLDGA